MVYSATTWLSGSTITETQYAEIKATYMDKYSTASTGTSLLNITSTQTFTSPFFGTLLYFMIPPGVQQSRLELSITGVNAGGGNAYLYLYPSRQSYLGIKQAIGTIPPHDIVDNYPQYGAILTFNVTTNTGTTANTFSCMGGEYFNIGYINQTSGNATAWNIRLSGTSTTITDNCNWVT